jgi:hypothetical protein
MARAQAAQAYGADVTVTVQLPVAWTLKLSLPEAPVTSVRDRGTRVGWP